MSAFFVPTPCVIPLRVPKFGESKSIDNKTKIEILCESELPGIEVYYTLDGTKPQPYLGIVQGNKTLKYSKPFVLPAGKVTVKAMAIHSLYHTMHSNVITKSFYVQDVIKRTKVRKASPRNVRKSSLVGRENELHEREDTDTGSLKIVQREGTNGTQDQLAENTNQFEEKVSSGDDGSVEDASYFECTEENQLVNEDDEISQSYAAVSSQDDVDSDGNQDGNEEVNQCTDEDDALLIDVPEPESNTVPKSEAEENDPCVEPESSLNHQCAKLELPLQQCFMCNKVTSLLSRYCDACGEKLHKVCNNCEEHNPVIAKFCQFCGTKFSLQTEACESSCLQLQEPKEKPKSKGILVKPKSAEKSSFASYVTADQSVQTVAQDENSPKRHQMCRRMVPSSTPGRGFWRQQMDYVCNHLKAHANNNAKFQKAVGAPPLGQFLSAEAVEKDGCMSICITFEVLPGKEVDPASVV